MKEWRGKREVKTGEVRKTVRGEGWRERERERERERRHLKEGGER